MHTQLTHVHSQLNDHCWDKRRWASSGEFITYLVVLMAENHHHWLRIHMDLQYSLSIYYLSRRTQKKSDIIGTGHLTQIHGIVSHVLALLAVVA